MKHDFESVDCLSRLLIFWLDRCINSAAETSIEQLAICLSLVLDELKQRDFKGNTGC